MDSVDTGKDKIKKICEILKTETIEPAKHEAAAILEQAQEKSQRLLREAEEKAQQLINGARKKIEDEKKLFNSTLVQACQQILESLRQDIENKLLNSSLMDWIEKETVDPKVSANLITALAQAIEKEGTSADFSAVVAKTVTVEQVNALLAKEIVQKLKGQSVEIGEFAGGVQLKLLDRKLTLDLSDEALKELLGRYIRKDFREILFQT